MSSASDLVGQTFGNLIVVRRVENNKFRRTCWECLCACGSLHVVSVNHLKDGHTRNCGVCALKGFVSRATKHGHSRVGERSAEYKAWMGMNNRTTCSKSKSWHHYGGRGIIVCDRWSLFENFYEDMGPKPSPQHTLDRYPDQNGNYCPENCRWATREEQNNNLKRNRLLTHDGDTMTLAQWGRKLGWPADRLAGRLRRGWSVEDTLTLPLFSKPAQRKGFNYE